MKNPTQPNFKTEWYPVFTIALSFLAAFYFKSILPDALVLSWDNNGLPSRFISWTPLAYAWPVLLLIVYSMFLFFPYFEINHTESAALKDQWHKAKELSLSFFFVLQVVGGLILSGQDSILFWALPILFSLLLISVTPTVTKVLSYRKKHPLKLK
jgi:hypothetical protein